MADMIGAEWLAWKNHPKTREFVAHLEGAVFDYKEEWADGYYMSSDQHTFVVENSRKAGAVKQVQLLLSQIDAIRLEDDQNERK